MRFTKMSDGNTSRLSAPLLQLRDMFPRASEKVLLSALSSNQGHLGNAIEHMLSSGDGGSGEASPPEGKVEYGQTVDGVAPRSLPMGVMQLGDMFPNMPASTVLSVYEECVGDVERAAAKLLEHPQCLETALSKPPASQDSIEEQTAAPSSQASTSSKKVRARRATPTPRKRKQASEAVEAPSSSSGVVAPEHPKQKAALLEVNDVKLPLHKLQAPPTALVPDSKEFAWGSLKTKATLQKTTFGPDAGSTWLWFLAADLVASEKQVDGDIFTDIHIVGDKFQAGWLRDASLSPVVATLRRNQCSFLQSEIDGTVNDRGVTHRGVPEGFSHAWHYSDSVWSLGQPGATTDWPTSLATWSEVKKKDRWRVDIRMRWKCAVGAQQQRYFLVAEQRAEKLNPNQYATAMRGTMIPIQSDEGGQRMLHEVLQAYQSSTGSTTKKIVSGSLQGSLHKWMRKRSGADMPSADSKRLCSASAKDVDAVAK